MKNKRKAPVFDRVLVAFDQAKADQALLNEAASLAAGFRAELVGLFFEDTELLSAAGLPVTRLVSEHGRTPQSVDVALMRQALKAHFTRTRSAIEAAAARWHVRCSFQIAPADLEQLTAAVAGARNLLALQSARKGGAKAISQLVTLAPCQVLLVQNVRQPSRPVLVVYEGSEQSLALGEALSKVKGSRFIVLLVGDKQAELERLASDVREWTNAHSVQCEIRLLPDSGAEAIVNAVHGSQAGVVILNRRGRWLGEADSLLMRLQCSIITVP